jgi:hypothetical protein
MGLLDGLAGVMIDLIWCLYRLFCPLLCMPVPVVAIYSIDVLYPLLESVVFIAAIICAFGNRREPPISSYYKEPTSDLYTLLLLLECGSALLARQRFLSCCIMLSPGHRAYCIRELLIW